MYDNAKSEFSHSKTTVRFSRLIPVCSIHSKGVCINFSLVIDGVFADILFGKSEDRFLGAEATVDSELSDLIGSLRLNGSSWLPLNVHTLKLHRIPLSLILIFCFPRHKIFYYYTISINRPV